jgi:hypothetical protein
MSRVRNVSVTVLSVLAGLALVAPSAQAAPPSAQLDGTYTCSTGQSYVVYVSEHSLVGYIDGRGVAPRAFQFTSQLSLEVQDGPYAGDVITAGVESPVAGPNNKPVKEVALQGTSTCVQTALEEVEFVVGQEEVEFFGIDPKYLGSTVSGTEDASITVYVTSSMLDHR